MKTVRIKSGLTQVVLPDGNAYDGDKQARLTDAQFAQIAPSAIGDEVLLVANSVAIGDDANDLRLFHIPLLLSAVADGDQTATTFTPGFAGTVRSVRFIADTPATTAAKTTTLSLKINNTAVTGGAVTVTTAAADTKGEATAGTAVTAANTFTATDTLKAVAASTTAFVEGDGYLEVLVSVS